MKTHLLSILFLIFIATSACHDNNSTSGGKGARAGASAMAENLPADVLSLTKPLISGAVYGSPSFEGEKIAHFDTSQQIQVLDTSDVMFIRARIAKDSSEYTGYVSKAILPEER